MLAAIRIRGRLNVNPKTRDTLKCLNLPTKHSCTLIPDNKTFQGMVKKAKNWIAYGPVKKETAKKLIMKRGKINGQDISEDLLKKEKIKIDKVLKNLEAGEKKLQESGISPTFRLGPARGGFKSVLKHYPKGALGEWPEIDSLLERMI